jgi:ketol-acid reductoisomerase
MMHMWTSVSNTAEYGGLSTRDKVINAESKKAMEGLLDDIIAGKFAKEWIKDANGGMKKLQAMEKKEAESEIEVVGKEIRSLFEIKAAPKKKKAAPKKAPAKKGTVKPAAPAKKAVPKKAPAKKAPVKKKPKA